MAYTQSDLDQLDRDILTVERLVRDGQSVVEYRPLDELLSARAHVAQQLQAELSRVAVGRPAGGIYRFRPVTSRGF